jgi:hypothetical protein
MSDETRRAKIIRRANERTAHHEAGHAVAAVARGGRLVDVSLGEVDWFDLDTSSDQAAFVRHESTLENQPFATFAGPWATAMWMTAENDPDDEPIDFDEALDYAWADSSDGDQAKYENIVGQLEGVAATLGLVGIYGGEAVGRAWENDWRDELEQLWPAVREIAAKLLDGTEVTHEIAVAAVERCSVDD